MDLCGSWRSSVDCWRELTPSVCWEGRDCSSDEPWGFREVLKRLNGERGDFGEAEAELEEDSDSFWCTLLSRSLLEAPGRGLRPPGPRD